MAFPEVFKHLENRGGDLVKSKELCPTAEDPDAVIKGMKKWLKDEGLNDLESVSLFADQLEAVSLVCVLGIDTFH